MAHLRVPFTEISDRHSRMHQRRTQLIKEKIQKPQSKGQADFYFREINNEYNLIEIQSISASSPT